MGQREFPEILRSRFDVGIVFFDDLLVLGTESGHFLLKRCQMLALEVSVNKSHKAPTFSTTSECKRSLSTTILVIVFNRALAEIPALV